MRSLVIGNQVPFSIAISNINHIERMYFWTKMGYTITINEEVSAR